SILAADVQNTTSGAVTTTGVTNLNVSNETTSPVSQISNVSSESSTSSVSAVSTVNQTTGATTQISATTNVTNLTASSKTTSVSLTWNTTLGISSLFIVNWTDGSVSNSNNTSNLSYNVTGLTAGVNYTFSVTAVAADNQTKGATSQISTFTNPGVVTNLTVSSKTTSSVSLTWNKPSGNSNLFIVNWTDGSVNISNNTSNLSYNVTGLTAGVNYTFSVTAVAADGQTTGATTQISTFTYPNVVSNLTISSKSTSSVYLTWNAPPGNSSFFIVNWTAPSVSISSNTSSMSYNVTGPTAGVNYTFSVPTVATDGQTTGAPTQISTFSDFNSLTVSSETTSSVSLTGNAPPGNSLLFTVNWTDGSVSNSNNTSNLFYTVTGLTAGVSYTFSVTAVAADGQTKGETSRISTFTYPNVVRSLTPFNKTTSSVFLTWNKPLGSSYLFIVSWTGGSVSNSSNTSNMFYNVTGLTAGVNYTFSVTAVAADNQTKGATSQISTFTKPDVVTNLTVSSKTTSSVSLTWNKPSGNSNLFIVNWTGDSVNISNNTYNVTGLTAGVNYTFSVTAVAADNQTTGATSQISTFTTPGVVTNLTVSNQTTSSVSLTWNAPPGNSSLFIVNWTDGSVSNGNNTSDLYYTVTGLTAGVSYTFSVTAVTTDGQTTGAPTQKSAFTKPDTVSNLTVVNVTTSSILLSWTQSMGKISYYVIQYENNTTTINNTAESTMSNITDLTPGVQYTFRVFAVAGDKNTEGNYSCISAYTKPDVATDLSVTEITTSSLFLNWTEPIGERSFFKVQWSNGSITLNSTTSNTSFNISDLNPGVNYTFLISAVAADNVTEGGGIGLSAYT
ncbi:receptor-type tyrosine-protein phosphatase eta-like, partial [Clarias magur]